MFKFKNLSSLILTLTIAAFAASAAHGAFTVQTVTGGVQVRTSATGAWTKATPGMKLSSGASVKTAPDGACVLKSPTGNGVKVSKMTVVDISKLESDASGKENTMLNLNSGRVLATVNKASNKGSSFQVKTPTAVAGVRGTDFYAELTPEGDSKIGVTDGEIAVEVGGVEVVVDENLQLDVSSSGEVGEPAAIPEDVKQEIQQETQDMKADMQLEVKAEDESKESKESKESAKEEKKEDKEEAKADKEEAKADKEEAKEEAKEESKEEASSGDSAEGDDSADATDTGDSADAVDTSAADVASDSVDSVIDNQIINDTVDQAQEAMDTGSVTVDIYIGQ